MKTQSVNTRITALMSVLIAVMVLMSCSKDVDVPTPSNYPSNDGTLGDLSATEQNDLRFMAEKEKLMTIIYGVMYDVYNKDIFYDIYKSKERHTNKLAAQIDKYELDNPITNMGDEEFENYNLQQIYSNFLSISQSGLPNVLKFVKTMEEQHIAEVEGFIAQLEGNTDITSIYNLCLTESINHLEILLIEYKGGAHVQKPFDFIREL